MLHAQIKNQKFSDPSYHSTIIIAIAITWLYQDSRHNRSRGFFVGLAFDFFLNSVKVQSSAHHIAIFQEKLVLIAGCRSTGQDTKKMLDHKKCVKRRKTDDLIFDV